jgi:hypothetical protein
MRTRTTPRRLLAALPLTVAAVLVLAPQAQAGSPAPTPAPTPAPITSTAPVPGPPAAAAPTVVPAEKTPGQELPRDTRESGQVAAVPAGAPETGGGATADGGADPWLLLALGGAGLAGAAGAVGLRRRAARPALALVREDDRG